MAINGRIEVVSSWEMIGELREVLSRDKFGLSKTEQLEMVNFIISMSRMVVLKSRFKIVKDPDDDMVANTAYDGKVAYIVSGDKHLLELKKFSGIRIVKASEMLKLI